MAVGIVALIFRIDIERAQGDRPAAGNLVHDLAGNPDRALGRDDEAGLVGHHRHDAGTGIEDLDALMGMGRIDKSGRVFVCQRDHGALAHIEIMCALHRVLFGLDLSVKDAVCRDYDKSMKPCVA